MNEALVFEWLEAPGDLIEGALMEASQTTDVDAILRHRDNLIVPALDKLAAMTCVLVDRNQVELVGKVASQLYAVYELPEELKLHDLPQREVHFGPSYIWQQVIIRVYVAGALAVRKEAYPLVPILARRSVSWDTYWSKSYWARHALTMLAREKRLRTRSLCGDALLWLEENPYFMQMFGRSDRAKERATDSLCRFDFLQNVMAFAESNDRLVYPNFAFFRNSRVMPLVRDLVAGGSSRQAIPFPLPNEQLAGILIELDKMAGKEAFLVGGWDSGEWPADVRDFLLRHRIQP